MAGRSAPSMTARIRAYSEYSSTVLKFYPPVVRSVASVMSVPTTLLIPAAAPYLAPIAARRNMLILSASSCASVLVLISSSTVFVEVDAAAVAVFEAFSTDERMTRLVNTMAFHRVGDVNEQSFHAITGAFIILPFEDALDLFLQD